MRVCPNCHSCLLRVRTDLDYSDKWLRCDICRYAEPNAIYLNDPEQTCELCEAELCTCLLQQTD